VAVPNFEAIAADHPGRKPALFVHELRGPGF
jgi:hypothetical protein